MSPRLAVFAFSLLAGASAAFAQSSDAEKPDPKLVAAIAACDKGAAAPLDPTATEPPVPFSELFPPDFDLGPLRAVADACKFAAEKKPTETRLWLQWLRTELSLGQRFEPYMAGRVESLAGQGSPEANYLVFFTYRAFKDTGIDRAKAEAALRIAAAAGHRDALMTMVDQLRSGPNLRRDPHEAARFAALLAELPSQGMGRPSDTDREMIALGELLAAGVPLVEEGFSPEERARAFTAISELYQEGRPGTLVPLVNALRFGRGTEADPARARTLLEAAVAADDGRALVELAEMLAEGEGGPADGRRAIALLTDPLAAQASFAAWPVLAGLYLDNRYTGPRPRAALRMLAATDDIDARIRAAGLFLDYDERLDYPDGYAATMDAATEVGEPGAAMAWARLKLSNHPQFGNRDEEARTILMALAAQGDAEAAIMVAETQYIDLDAGRFNPHRRDGGMTDPEIRSVLEAAMRDGRASAYRVMAKLQRVGAVYPQDDVAATRSLVEAAERDDVEAMVLLGVAYADGLGTPENPRERLRWWRAAARLGSLAATEKLVDAFGFDSFDKLMTLREGITAKVALYNNGPAPDALFGDIAVSGFMGTFIGGRAMDAGFPALAEAVMDGFRMAPAGLDDVRLVPLARAFPDEIRIEIETALKRDGFYEGAPEGYFGPEVRAALAAWVDARGPLAGEEPAGEGGGESAGAAPEALPADLVDRIRDRVFSAATKPDLTDDERDRIIGDLNVLAQYGDIPSRWALLRNYHQSAAIRGIVGPGDVTRYGLDLVVTRPEQAEKVDFEFIFTVSAMYEEGTSGAFGEAFVVAVRDDPRLQDPLTLGGVMQQVLFAPGGCDAVLEAAGKAGLAVTGDDGCADVVQAALIAHAKDAGPAGVEAAIRAAAAETLRGMDVAAN
jgi:TPR repeat protein/peptidoglycan hydrolase-like protein with peptidoglycan-binding domain